MESDEESAARGGVSERGRAAVRRARCAEEAWARIERERGRQRQIPCLTRLGSMRSSARTPRRPRPSFLPSFSLLGSSLPSPSYLTRSVVSPSLLCYPPLRFSFSVSLFSCPSLSRSFPRVSSSVLSCRAADADAGASGIAATVGAATHPLLHLPPRSTHRPFALRSLRPLHPFRKAASLAVGATHTPLTALHNACNPPHPPIPTTHRPTDYHPPSARRSSPLLVLHPTVLSCHAASSTLFHWLRHTAHTQAHTYTHMRLPFPARTYTQRTK